MSEHHAKSGPDAATDKAPRRRLFIDLPLAPDAEIRPPKEVSHRLLNVLRLGPGETIALFNGREGEWSARLDLAGKREVRLLVDRMLRPQPAEAAVRLCFAPIRQQRVEWLVEKATELGVTMLSPVQTRRTQPGRLRADRLAAIAIEAAEQCERLSVPVIEEMVPLDHLLAEIDSRYPLYFCDERGDAPLLPRVARPAPIAILVGPEGGFAPDEAGAIRARPGVIPVSLGPHILRAETAGIAGLAMWVGAGC